MKKGIYVGEFNERDLDSGADKAAVAKKMAETGLSYTNTEVVYKNGRSIGMKIWVCSADEFEV